MIAKVFLLHSLLIIISITYIFYITKFLNVGILNSVLSNNKYTVLVKTRTTQIKKCHLLLKTRVFKIFKDICIQDLTTINYFLL